MGNKRCQKVGIYHATCLGCAEEEGRQTTETTRHANLECPLSKRVLSMTYRTYIQTSATNLDTIQHQLQASDDEIIRDQKLALITGYRMKDTARGSPAKRSGDTPFCVLIAETHAALECRRRHNDRREYMGRFTWNLQDIYRDIRYRMTQHIKHTHLEAKRLQTKRIIDNPGKHLEEDGPWFDWMDSGPGEFHLLAA